MKMIRKKWPAQTLTIATNRHICLRWLLKHAQKGPRKWRREDAANCIESVQRLEYT